jgi:hypothetical protein
MFEQVSRNKSKLRMALTGVSGSGKTLGALYIAFGITGDWSKIALIDTEHERARFYANREDLGTGAFLYQSMYAPFSPDRYKQMVKDGAAAVGADGVVIVDSLTHAWNSEGGVLDIKDRIASRAGQNSYTAWSEAGKEQTSLVNTIFAVGCHTIATMRSKMAYELQEDDKGKKKPVKMGLAPIQRDDTEYEFDIVLDIGRDHIATASKDVTFLDKYGQIITPELGKQLGAWLNDGLEPAPKTEEVEPEPLICEECGSTILRTKENTAQERYDGTKARTGKAMCAACYKAWNAKQKATA